MGTRLYLWAPRREAVVLRLMRRGWQVVPGTGCHHERWSVLLWRDEP